MPQCVCVPESELKAILEISVCGFVFFGQAVWLIICHEFFAVFTDSQMKDNPAFSMLNDSDDEVIYG